MNTFDESDSEDYTAFDAAMPVAPAARDFLPTAINPDAPHWSWLSAVGILIFSIFSLILFSGLGLFFYALYNKGFPATAEVLVRDPLAVIFSLISVFPAHLLTLGIAWMLVTRNGKQPFFQTLGWNWGEYFGLWACVGTTVALFGIAVLIASIFGEQENDLTRMLQSSRTAVYLTAILATFTAPLVEEVVYRGVLYSAFRQNFGAAAAVLLTTVVFTAIHVPQYLPSYGTIIVICLLSLVLTLIRAWTRSLLPCVVIHTIFNGVQAVLLIIEPYLRDKVTPIEPAPNLILKIVSFFG